MAVAVFNVAAVITTHVRNAKPWARIICHQKTEGLIKSWRCCSSLGDLNNYPSVTLTRICLDPHVKHKAVSCWSWFWIATKLTPPLGIKKEPVLVTELPWTLTITKLELHLLGQTWTALLQHSMTIQHSNKPTNQPPIPNTSRAWSRRYIGYYPHCVPIHTELHTPMLEP